MQQSPFDLSEKTFVVTGASSGIGRQCAISLAQQGARTILIGRDIERLKDTCSQLDTRLTHQYHVLDITAYDEVKDWAAKLTADKIKIDGVVNAAGISPTLPLRATTPEQMEAAFKTNVVAAMNLSKLLCKPALMNSDGGSVVFLSSVMGSVGEMGKSLYGMTKGALVSGIKSLALEYAPKKIRFNCISPAVVITPMSMSSVYSKDEEAFNKVKSYHPLGLGEPEDVAHAVIYLLSPASKWVTGINLVLDGGYTAK